MCFVIIRIKYYGQFFQSVLKSSLVYIAVAGREIDVTRIIRNRVDGSDIACVKICSVKVVFKFQIFYPENSTVFRVSVYDSVFVGIQLGYI